MGIAWWSAFVSAIYAFVALVSQEAAQVLVVAFIAALIIPATTHLVRRTHGRRP